METQTQITSTHQNRRVFHFLFSNKSILQSLGLGSKIQSTAYQHIHFPYQQNQVQFCHLWITMTVKCLPAILDQGSIPGSGRSPGEGNGNPLQYSCLENSMDGGAWQATVHGVTKNQTRLSNFASLHMTSYKNMCLP